MFISRKSHDLIVAEIKQSHELIEAELRARIAELQKVNDQLARELRAKTDDQAVELKTSRDFYRKQWTKLQGKAFPSTLDMPLFDDQSPKSPAFDDGWTVDDRDLFQRWAIDLPRDVKAEDEYQRMYGNTPPLLALTV